MRAFHLPIPLASVAAVLILSAASADSPSPEELDLARYIRSGPQYVFGDEERVKISVNVWGEVDRPGSYLVPDDTDLVTLLSLAGGPTAQADITEVRVVRFHATRPATDTVDLKQLLDSPGTVPPGLLPGDTVRVPRRSGTTLGGVLRALSEIAIIFSTVVLVIDRVGE